MTNPAYTDAKFYRDVSILYDKMPEASLLQDALFLYPKDTALIQFELNGKEHVWAVGWPDGHLDAEKELRAHLARWHPDAKYIASAFRA